MRAREFLDEKDFSDIAKPKKQYRGQLPSHKLVTPKRKRGAFATPVAGRTERPGE